MSAALLGVDPGESVSAWALWDPDTESVNDCGIATNATLADLIALKASNPFVTLVLEVPAILGKQRVHAELLETARWVGVFEGAWRGNQREDIAHVGYHAHRTHHTRDSNANEAAVKAALISRFAPGCRPRKNVGAFALVPTGKVVPAGKPLPTSSDDEVSSSHIWSAISVAVYTADKRRAA